MTNFIDGTALSTAATVADEAPGMLATATNAVKQVALDNPVAVSVAAGAILGVGAAVLVYEAGPAILRNIQDAWSNARDWLGRQISSTPAPSTEGPIIDGKAEPAEA